MITRWVAVAALLGLSLPGIRVLLAIPGVVEDDPGFMFAVMPFIVMGLLLVGVALLGSVAAAVISVVGSDRGVPLPAMTAAVVAVPAGALLAMSDGLRADGVIVLGCAIVAIVALLLPPRGA